MNGFIRTISLYIFVFFIVMLSITLSVKNALKITIDNAAPIGVYEAILA